jgi:hypothetical protein
MRESVFWVLFIWLCSCIYKYNISSVSIVSGYRLDDQAIVVRFPAEAEDLSSSLCVLTAPGSTQPPVQRVAGVLSSEVKSGRGVTLTTHPHLVLRFRMNRSYASSPPCASKVCCGTALLFYSTVSEKLPLLQDERAEDLDVTAVCNLTCVYLFVVYLTTLSVPQTM